MSNSERSDSVSRLIHDSIDRRVNRRNILRRGAALGVAAPMLAAMIKVSETTTVFAQDAGEIVVGCPYNLTGSLQSIDVPAKDGSLLAAKLLNASGGVLGKQLKLVVENGESDVTTVGSWGSSRREAHDRGALPRDVAICISALGAPVRVPPH